MKKVTARKRQEPFRTVTWNLAGSGRGPFGTVLGLRENDGETFRKLEELDTQVCHIFMLGNSS